MWLLAQGPSASALITLPAFRSGTTFKSNQIKSNQIKSNQIKSNQIKSNQTNAHTRAQGRRLTRLSLELKRKPFVAVAVAVGLTHFWAYSCIQELN
jgi:hypothetical protein